MKLKGSPASVRKGSLRQSFVDKTCIGVCFGPSPYFDTKHTIYELCLPIERGFGYEYGFSDLLVREVQ